MALYTLGTCLPIFDGLRLVTGPDFGITTGCTPLYPFSGTKTGTSENLLNCVPTTSSKGARYDSTARVEGCSVHYVAPGQLYNNPRAYGLEHDVCVGSHINPQTINSVSNTSSFGEPNVMITNDCCENSTGPEKLDFGFEVLFRSLDYWRSPPEHTIGVEKLCSRLTDMNDACTLPPGNLSMASQCQSPGFAHSGIRGQNIRPEIDQHGPSSHKSIGDSSREGAGVAGPLTTSMLDGSSGTCSQQLEGKTETPVSASPSPVNDPSWIKFSTNMSAGLCYSRPDLSRAVIDGNAKTVPLRSSAWRCVHNHQGQRTPCKKRPRGASDGGSNDTSILHVEGVWTPRDHCTCALQQLQRHFTRPSQYLVGKELSSVGPAQAVLAFDMGGVSVAVLGSTATISISLGLRALISALFGSFLFLIWSRAVSRLASASIHAQRATRSVLKAVISETSPAISMLAFPITVAAAVTCVHVTGVGLWAGIILDILCSGMFNPIAIATNATSHTARTAVRAALPQIALFGKCIVGTASFSAILVPIVLVGASIVVVLAPLAACATARYICATLVRRNRATQSVEGGEMPEEGYYEPEPENVPAKNEWSFAFVGEDAGKGSTSSIKLSSFDGAEGKWAAWSWHARLYFDHHDCWSIVTGEDKQPDAIEEPAAGAKDRAKEIKVWKYKNTLMRLAFASACQGAAAIVLQRLRSEDNGAAAMWKALKAEYEKVDLGDIAVLKSRLTNAQCFEGQKGMDEGDSVTVFIGELDNLATALWNALPASSRANCPELSDDAMKAVLIHNVPARYFDLVMTRDAYGHDAAAACTYGEACKMLKSHERTMLNRDLLNGREPKAKKTPGAHAGEGGSD